MIGHVKIAAVTIALGAPGAWAQTPDADYFIGEWTTDDPGNCATGDVMRFFPSGAWTIGAGGNQVESVGVWSIKNGQLVITASDLPDITTTETVHPVIIAAEANQLTVELTENARGETYILQRCGR